MKIVFRVNFKIKLIAIICICIINSSAAYSGLTIRPSTPSTQTPFVPGHYRALLIGNNTYEDTTGRWPSLNTAIADVKAIETLLRNQYGFNDITRLTNASRRDILLALTNLSQRVLPNDSVLIYYAGHGYLDDETNKGFWVPTDASGDDHTTYLRNSTIRDELSTLANRSKHSLLIADSCFSGTLLRRGAKSVSPDNMNNAYYNKVAKKRSVQIMTSGGEEFVDDNYRQSGHSPFTYFLLSELKHNDLPMITASELSTNVKKAVGNNVDQTPNSGVLAGTGDELGEFIFLNIKLQIDAKGIPHDKIKVKVDVVPLDSSKNATAKETSDKSETSNKIAPVINSSATVIEQKTPKIVPQATTKPNNKSANKPIIYPIPSL